MMVKDIPAGGFFRWNGRDYQVHHHFRDPTGYDYSVAVPAGRVLGSQSSTLRQNIDVICLRLMDVDENAQLREALDDLVDARERIEDLEASLEDAHADTVERDDKIKAMEDNP